MPNDVFAPDWRYTSTRVALHNGIMNRAYNDAPCNALNRIRHYRKRLGMTLEQLALKTGFSWQALQRYETEVRPITLDKLQIVADAMDLPLSALVVGHEELTEEEQQILDWMRNHPRDRRLIASQVQVLRETANDDDHKDNHAP